MLQDVKPFHPNPLDYLSEDQIRDIHSATLEITEDVGAVIHHEPCLALLREAGATIKDGNRVFIPGAMVERAVRTAPSRITIYDRQGNPALFLENRKVYYGTGSDCPNLLDSFTGERRAFLRKDVEGALRVADALPHIDFIMSMGLAPDIPADIQYEQKYALMVRNSTKPQVITAADRDSLEAIAEIASIVAGGREALLQKPLFVLYDEPTSPLVHTGEALEKLLYMAENRLPINYSPGIMAGATSPVTIAGSVAQANAEILTGLVIHQLKKPGAPFVFGGGMSPMDMRSMQPTYAAPEAVVSQACLCQMGRDFYHLPTWGFGGCSASKLADEQAVYEAGSYLVMAAVTGTNLVHDVGYLEFGKTYSLDLLIICDEIIGHLRRMMEGVRVDEESLALEALKRVGPGGHFLADPHTVAHFRENWQPGITDRNTYETWQMNGSTSMGQRAKEKLKHLLDNHFPEPLSPEADKKIDDILAKHV